MEEYNTSSNFAICRVNVGTTRRIIAKAPEYMKKG